MGDYRIVRRKDREITVFDEIADIFRRADTIRLGLNGDPFPYVVPLSYGFEASGPDTIDVYVHGAKEGWKHDLIARDNHVCVEAGIFHSYREHGGAAGSDVKSVTTEYESAIGYGVAEQVTGAEAEHGVGLLFRHCGFPGYAYDRAALDAMTVYRIRLTDVTGKRRFV